MLPSAVCASFILLSFCCQISRVNLLSACHDPVPLGQLEENHFEKARRVKGSCAGEFFFFFQATRLIRKRYLVPNTSTCLVCKRKERTLIPVLGLYDQNWIPDHHWSQFWGVSLILSGTTSSSSPKT